MSIAEMHKKLRVLFDGMDTFSAPELTSEAIDVILNKCQDDLINEIEKTGYESNQRQSDYLSPLVRNFVTSSFSTGNKPFGKIATVPSDCRKILLERAEVSYPDCCDVSKVLNSEKYIVIEGTVVYENNTYSEGDVFFGGNSVSYSGKGKIRKLIKKIVSIKPETRDRYNKVVKNPFKKPSLDELIRLKNSQFENEIISDKFIILEKYFLDYYKNPVKMQYGSQYATPSFDIDCELSEEAQNRIVEKASVEIKKILMQQDYQIYKQEEILNKV